MRTPTGAVWCKVMDKETFSDTAVANFMNDKFLPGHYEMETGFGLVMSEKIPRQCFSDFSNFYAGRKTCQPYYWVP